MSRIVFWIILIVVVGFAIRAKLRAAGRRAEQHVPPPRTHGAAVIEDMTSCAHCGLHFPASEAIRVEGQDYCSPAHAAKIGN